MDLYISGISNNQDQLPALSSPSLDTDASASYNSMPVANAIVTEGHLPAHPESVEAPIPHSNNLKDRICQICYMAFKTPTNLQDHYRIHLEDRKQFACTECFFPPNNKIRDDFNKKDFTKHMKIHTAEKPYICTVCHKGFAYKKNLTAHKKTHTGEKPFKCDSCHKPFARKKNLKRHSRIHTGEKPFKCKVCFKAFNQSEALTRHSRIHTRYKPFKCTFCDEAFMRNRCLKRHIRIHSPKTNSAVNINLPMGYQNNNEAISNKINGLDIYSLDPAKVAEIKKSLEKELANFNSLETNSAVNINPSMEYQSNNDNATRLQQEISYPMDFNFYDLPSNFNLDDTDENM